MKNRSLKYTLALAVVGVVITLFIMYAQRGIFRSYQQNMPYINMANTLTERATEVRLLLEEALANNTSVDFKTEGLSKLTSLRNVLQSTYDGKETEFGSVPKSDDEDLKALLKETINDADRLINAATERWQVNEQQFNPGAQPQPNDSTTAPADSSVIRTVVETPSSNTNQEAGNTGKGFQMSYAKFQTSLNLLGEYATNKLHAQESYFKKVSVVSILFVVISFIVLCLLFFRFQQTNDALAAERKIKLADQADAIEKLSSFIEAVSTGDYTVDLQLTGDDGSLTTRLITMRDRLKENAENERKRNWSTMGLAQIGEILRAKTSNIDELYDNIIRFVVKHTRSNQGGLFIINEDEDIKRYLELVACYAFERKKFLTKIIDPGEGLVGQCYMEGERIYLKDVPDEYMAITSGLGGSKPKTLLLVPMKLNDKIYGVIELATFSTYEDYEIELVEKLAESIGSTISTVRFNDSTSILLEKTQQQTEEMKAQEEEIRQNMEELEATQEEMKRQQVILEKELAQSLEQSKQLQLQEKKIMESQSTLQSIVDNIPRAIFWKDTNLKFLGCNKIFANVAGVSSHHDLLGKSDYDMSWRAQAEAYRKDDFDVIKSRVAKLEIEEVNINNDGEESWVLTSKVPIADQNDEVIAILGMFEDITARKRRDADVEKKMIEYGKALKEIETLKKRLEAKG